MSGFVAHKLSGFRAPKEVLIETDRMVTGDSENESDKRLKLVHDRRMNLIMNINGLKTIEQLE